MTRLRHSRRTHRIRRIHPSSPAQLLQVVEDIPHVRVVHPPLRHQRVERLAVRFETALYGRRYLGVGPAGGGPCRLLMWARQRRVADVGDLDDGAHHPEGPATTVGAVAHDAAYAAHHPLAHHAGEPALVLPGHGDRTVVAHTRVVDALAVRREPVDIRADGRCGGNRVRPNGGHTGTGQGPSEQETRDTQGDKPRRGDSKPTTPHDLTSFCRGPHVDTRLRDGRSGGPPAPIAQGTGKGERGARRRPVQSTRAARGPLDPECASHLLVLLRRDLAERKTATKYL